MEWGKLYIALRNASDKSLSARQLVKPVSPAKRPAIRQNSEGFLHDRRKTELKR